MANAIELMDAAGTPVKHTFNPVGFLPAEPDVFLFEDRAAGSFIGFWRIKASVIRPNGLKKVANGELKVKIQISTPKLETLGNASNGIKPPDTVAYVPRADITFYLHERCDQLDRDNLAKMVPLLVNDPQIQAMIKLYQRIPS